MPPSCPDEGLPCELHSSKNRSNASSNVGEEKLLTPNHDAPYSKHRSNNPRGIDPAEIPAGRFWLFSIHCSDVCTIWIACQDVYRIGLRLFLFQESPSLFLGFRDSLTSSG